MMRITAVITRARARIPIPKEDANPNCPPAAGGDFGVVVVVVVVEVVVVVVVLL